MIHQTHSHRLESLLQRKKQGGGVGRRRRRLELFKNSQNRIVVGNAQPWKRTNSQPTINQTQFPTGLQRHGTVWKRNNKGDRSWSRFIIASMTIFRCIAFCLFWWLLVYWFRCEFVPCVATGSLLTCLSWSQLV
jgi:hypothetical protein